MKAVRFDAGRAATMAAAPFVDRLPDELLLAVLARLPLPDLAEAAHVSRRWRALAHDEGLWRARLPREAPALARGAPSDICRTYWRARAHTRAHLRAAHGVRVTQNSGLLMCPAIALAFAALHLWLARCVPMAVACAPPAAALAAMLALDWRHWDARRRELARRRAAERDAQHVFERTLMLLVLLATLAALALKVDGLLPHAPWYLVMMTPLWTIAAVGLAEMILSMCPRGRLYWRLREIAGTALGTVIVTALPCLQLLLIGVKLGENARVKWGAVFIPAWAVMAVIGIVMVSLLFGAAEQRSAGPLVMFGAAAAILAPPVTTVALAYCRLEGRCSTGWHTILAPTTVLALLVGCCSMPLVYEYVLCLGEKIDVSGFLRDAPAALLEHVMRDDDARETAPLLV